MEAKRLRRALGLLAVLLISGNAIAQVSRLRLTGSTTMAPLMVEVAKRFQAQHPLVQIDVRMGGSGQGVRDVRQGKADIGMVSRALNETEQDIYGVPIGRDGVSVIVHRDNSIGALSNNQLIGIYSGKITNWRQVGGQDAPIRVLAGTREGGSSELFSHYLGISYDQIKAQGRIAANSERIKAVSIDPLAIIYVSVGEAERRAQEGAFIKLLAVDGIAANSRNVRNGNYPLSRPLTLITREPPAGITRTFIEFCVSSQITDLVVTFDFVPYLD